MEPQKQVAVKTGSEDMVNDCRNILTFFEGSVGDGGLSLK